LIKQFKTDGITVCCKVLGVAKSTFYASRNLPSKDERFETKYLHIKKIVRLIIEENPAYGYRRILSELRDTHKIIINHKPLERLLKLWGLSLKRYIKAPEKSGILKILRFLGVKANLVKLLGSVLPFCLIYTDMTEINYAQGKLYLIVYLDHTTKKIMGYALGKHPNTELALRAYAMAKETLKRELKRLKLLPKEIIVHQDQGSIYTSYTYVQKLLEDNLTLSYSRPATPTDNPEMESWNGRFKTENRQIFNEAQTEEELRHIVIKQIVYYNQKRRHSSLQNISPDNYIKKLTNVTAAIPS
jgi:putative transposase